MVLLVNIFSMCFRSVQYYDVTGRLTAFSSENAPEDLEKKTTLLLYFAKYMDEHLIQVNLHHEAPPIICSRRQFQILPLFLK